MVNLVTGPGFSRGSMYQDERQRMGLIIPNSFPTKIRQHMERCPSQANDIPEDPHNSTMEWIIQAVQSMDTRTATSRKCNRHVYPSQPKQTERNIHPANASQNRMPMPYAYARKIADSFPKLTTQVSNEDYFHSGPPMLSFRYILRPVAPLCGISRRPRSKLK